VRRAGGEIDMRRQLVLDDRGNHRAVLLSGGGTRITRRSCGTGGELPQLREPEHDHGEGLARRERAAPGRYLGYRAGPIWLLAFRHFRVARDRIPADQAPGGMPPMRLSGPRIRPARATGRAHPGHRWRPDEPPVAPIRPPTLRAPNITDR
jgi:hypothetical protein